MEECIPLDDSGFCSRPAQETESRDGSTRNDIAEVDIPINVSTSSGWCEHDGHIEVPDVPVQPATTTKIPPHYMPLSIITCVLVPPFGITALVFSKRCMQDIRNGRIQSAWKYSKLSLLAGFSGLFVLCVLSMVFTYIYLANHLFHSKKGSSSDSTSSSYKAETIAWTSTQVYLPNNQLTTPVNMVNHTVSSLPQPMAKKDPDLFYKWINNNYKSTEEDIENLSQSLTNHSFDSNFLRHLLRQIDRDKTLSER